ncbi:hypothetical protein OPKNFCMD_4376 [Methylobacterium crusticola]|uniref:Photosynthetic complex assembly protein n=1 Tax=Methylobacterium crusticola TaxID=1697972 RepID=A0ABQ4R459_9HYPH|nr:photosynthetic complex assembly protein PuhC [Methylobacterium crusticola]GJD51621.1 hypothetical protein OPKNFCMD_4376 [Methylobacterium crusticola]
MPEHTTPVPRTQVLRAGGLLVFALAAVAVGRVGDVGVTRLPEARAVESLDMTVADRADGAIAISDARDGRLVATVAPGTDGFVRATLRVLAQGRLREGFSREPPFRLTRWDNGTLSLDDTASGRRISLEAFGPTNAGAFARLLEQGRGAS